MYSYLGPCGSMEYHTKVVCETHSDLISLSIGSRVVVWCTWE